MCPLNSDPGSASAYVWITEPWKRYRLCAQLLQSANSQSYKEHSKSLEHDLLVHQLGHRTFTFSYNRQLCEYITIS